MSATIWRGRLVFGLVSIPVRIYKAAQRERIPFHYVHRLDDVSATASSASSKVRQFPTQPRAPEAAPLPERVGRVHRVLVGDESNIPLGKEDIFKGYEVEPDRYVVLSSADLAALRARSSTNLEIAEFVGLNEIDRNYFDASYHVAPDHGGEKAYALFYRALVETGCVAVGELVMYGREYAVVIRPGSRGLVLHTLFYANEVRVNEEAPADLGLVDRKELELAKMLINARRGTFDAAKLKDKFKERVLELVGERSRTAAPAGAPDGQRQSAPVVNILEALQKSLAEARKPPQSQAAGRSSRKKHRRRVK